MPKPVHTVQPEWSRVPPYYDGLYVGIDGLDGSGRTTLALALKTRLQSEGYPTVVVTPFPNTRTHQFITQVKHDRRLHAKSRHLLYASLFAMTTQHVILPHLTAGYVVLSDRSWLSLYARAVAQGLDTAWVRTTLGFALVPDMIIEPQSDPLSVSRRKLTVSDSLDTLESAPNRNSFEGFVEFQTQIHDILEGLKGEADWHLLNLQPAPSLEIDRIAHHIISQLEGSDAPS